MVIGIDPGVSGGVAVLARDGRVSHVAKMPETDRDLLELLQPYAMGDSRAFLELIHAMPKNGSQSAFKMGQSDGRLRFALTALQIPYVAVTPLKWQNAMQCRTKGDKNVSKARAQALFPSLKITHAIADALLIAEYGRQQSASLFQGEM